MKNSFFRFFLIFAFGINLLSGCGSSSSIQRDKNRLLYVQVKGDIVSQNDVYIAAKTIDDGLPPTSVLTWTSIKDVDILTDPIRKFRKLCNDQVPSLFFMDPQTCIYSYAAKGGIGTAVVKNGVWICTMVEKTDGTMILLVPEGRDEGQEYRKKCFEVLHTQLRLTLLSKELIWKQG